MQADSEQSSMAHNLFTESPGCGGPDEGFGMFIMIGEIPVDGDLQIDDAPEYPSTNPLTGDLREKAFHKIQPRAGCWSKMKVKARVTLQPCLHF